MDDQNDHESLGCRFISPDALVPSLQVIASNTVAFPILYNAISRHDIKNLNRMNEKDFVELENIILSKEGDAMIACLKMTWSTERILRQSLRKIYSELLKCLYYFQCGLVCGSLKEIAGEVSNFDQHFCVWRWNGTIDYHNTALNVLSKIPNQDKVLKFIVMSNFCMANKLETFDLNSLPRIFPQHVNFLQLDQNCLVYYWFRRLKNELSEIPLVRFHSIDAEMALKCLKIPDSWVLPKMSFSSKPRNAFEYFWHRLNIEDRISVARLWLNPDDVVNNTPPDRYYKHRLQDLLSMMSTHQQRRLLSRIPDQVILNFCLKVGLPYWVDSAIWAWARCRPNKDLIFSTEQFQTSVLDMFGKKGSNVEEDVFRVLIEIWRSAPNQLKKYVADIAKDQIASYVFSLIPRARATAGKPEEDSFDFDDSFGGFSSYDSCVRRRSITIVKFLHKFLSTVTDPEFRKEVILTKASVFVYFIGDPELFRRLLDLCLPNSKDLSDFKTSIANSIEMNETNVRLIFDHEFDKLKSRLKFYIPDSKTYEECVKGFLLQLPFDVKTYFVHGEEEWNQLSDFIDELYPSDETSASRLKKMFIESLVTGWDRNKKFGFTDERKSVFNVLQSVFKGEELKNFKQLFLENVERVYVDEYWQNSTDSTFDFYEFYKINLLKVVPWCLDYDKESIRQFKKVRLPVDVFYKRIFYLIVVNYDQNYVNQVLFAKIDQCLEWYMSKKQLKEYKLNGTADIRESLEILKENWKRNRCGRSEFNLMTILMWLCNGDQAAMNRFLGTKKLKVSR